MSRPRQNQPGRRRSGRRTSRRRATKAHPFGFGRERYLYGFVVALLLFTLGAVFAVYEGVHKVLDPKPLEAPLVAVVILLLAMVMEGFSFRTAVRESREHKERDESWWRFVRDAKIPELPLVLARTAAR